MSTDVKLLEWQLNFDIFRKNLNTARLSGHQGSRSPNVEKMCSEKRRETLLRALEDCCDIVRLAEEKSYFELEQIVEQAARLQSTGLSVASDDKKFGRLCAFSHCNSSPLLRDGQCINMRESSRRLMYPYISQFCDSLLPSKVLVLAGSCRGSRRSHTT